MSCVGLFWEAKQNVLGQSTYWFLMLNNKLLCKTMDIYLFMILWVGSLGRLKCHGSSLLQMMPVWSTYAFTVWWWVGWEVGSSWMSSLPSGVLALRTDAAEMAGLLFLTTWFLSVCGVSSSKSFAQAYSQGCSDINLWEQKLKAS